MVESFSSTANVATLSASSSTIDQPSLSTTFLVDPYFSSAAIDKLSSLSFGSVVDAGSETHSTHGILILRSVA